MTKTNDQITNLDAELDALSSPTTAETYVVSKDYDADVVAAAAARRALAGGGSRPFISDSEPGIVVNRASGFVSDWEAFDLLEPGAGYGEMTVTAADSDGLVWGVDVVPSIEIEMSADGTTWLPFYGSAITVAAAFTVVHEIDLGNPVVVGQKLAYVALVPRAVRFRGTVLDPQTGALYAGADDPTYTFTFTYTAS
jgi:hypothetical protein